MTMNANQDLLPSIRLVDTVVSNASASQPRLVGMDSKDILMTLKGQRENGREESIGKEERSAMQVSGATTAYCNSATCHTDVTCEEVGIILICTCATAAVISWGYFFPSFWRNNKFSLLSTFWQSFSKERDGVVKLFLGNKVCSG